MRVVIERFADLRRFGPPSSGLLEMEAPDGATLGQLVASLGIPESTPRVALINGRVGGDERRLRDGDKVTLFPPVEGG